MNTPYYNGLFECPRSGYKYAEMLYNRGSSTIVSLKSKLNTVVISTVVISIDYHVTSLPTYPVSALRSELLPFFQGEERDTILKPLPEALVQSIIELEKKLK